MILTYREHCILVVLMFCGRRNVTAYAYRKKVLVQPVGRNLTLSRCLLLFNHTLTQQQTCSAILLHNTTAFYYSIAKPTFSIRNVHKTGESYGHVTRRLERRQGCREVTERCGSRGGGDLARENKLATTFPVLSEHLQSSPWCAPAPPVYRLDAGVFLEY